MKNLKLSDLVIAFAVSAAVTSAAAFLLAFAAYRIGSYDSVGSLAGIAVLAGSFCGSLYLKKRSTQTGILIGTGIFLGFLMILSLITVRSTYGIPFLVPVCAAVGGILPFFMTERQPAKNVKRMIKKRTAFK